jgi:hypothetical protein
MKKNYLISLFLLLIFNLSHAQTNKFPPDGNVGIGTMSPNYKLDVSGTANFLQTIFIRSNFVNSAECLLYKANGGYYSLVSNNAGFQIYNSTNRRPILNADNSDNIGIGTIDTKGYKLAVAGNAIAESVTVKLQSDWPDYVFKKNYSLSPLSEVKTYIDQNSHLPDMPSAGQVTKEGINLGEMNKQLLKKVEELTLYLIEEDKEVHELHNQISDQGKEIDFLKKNITAIISRLPDQQK